jgi:hypothetical protein
MNAAMVVCCMNAALFVVMFGYINESGHPKAWRISN